MDEVRTSVERDEERGVLVVDVEVTTEGHVYRGLVEAPLVPETDDRTAYKHVSADDVSLGLTGFGLGAGAGAGIQFGTTQTHLSEDDAREAKKLAARIPGLLDSSVWSRADAEALASRLFEAFRTSEERRSRGMICPAWGGQDESYRNAWTDAVHRFLNQGIIAIVE